MYEQYFIGWDIKPEFRTEYISLWPNWLGKDNLHLLDEVTENEWKRFNALILSVSNSFNIGLIDRSNKTVSYPENIKSTFSTYSESMNKDDSQFSRYVLPKLDCLITEEDDYTYILWHKGNGAVEALRPHILKSDLQHFSDKRYGIA